MGLMSHQILFKSSQGAYIHGINQWSKFQPISMEISFHTYILKVFILLCLHSKQLVEIRQSQTMVLKRVRGALPTSLDVGGVGRLFLRGVLNAISPTIVYAILTMLLCTGVKTLLRVTV
jgi:hypothetical protein